MEKYLIIVAGGKGERFSAELPKQFAVVHNRPLLMHTFDAFTLSGLIDHIILVLPADYISYWNELCRQFGFHENYTIREGGPKRYHSVKSGLEAVPGKSLVAIHDAARPFVSKSLLNDGYDLALRKGNAIPVVDVEESLREVSGTLSKSVNREIYKCVQTPQFFRSSLIKNAYQQAYHEGFTDDASVLEATGEQIFIMQGEKENIKITHPADLAYADFLLRTKMKDPLF